MSRIDQVDLTADPGLSDEPSPGFLVDEAALLAANVPVAAATGLVARINLKQYLH